MNGAGASPSVAEWQRTIGMRQAPAGRVDERASTVLRR